MVRDLALNAEINYNKHAMKTISHSKNLRSLSLTATAFILLAITFTSCSKDNSNNNPPAYVQVTNAAEASTAQDFYVDSSKVTTSAVAYGSSSTFLTTKSGDHQGKFKSSGTATVDATLTLSLGAGNYYSVIYAESNAYGIYQDDRTSPQSGKARVRFINLTSALSSNVDFGVAGSAKLVSNLAYKAASTYYDVDIASAFSLFLTGSSSALVSLPATFQAGHIYTIYISGSTSATVTAHVITEN
jgi:hypothetical protein